MSFTTLDIQARCAALGHDPGPLDGVMGGRTKGAINAALEESGGSDVADLFHSSGIVGLCMHWTAGAHGVIDLERRHYNGVTDNEGQRHWGKWSDLDQVRYRAGIRGASHTLNFNSRRLGYSMDCMAGANERPFRAGSAPMTWDQVDGFTLWIAEKAVAYDLPATRTSIYTHSEVQPIFGIRQRWKWDINWLPDMDRPGNAIDVGDRLRALIREKMDRVIHEVHHESPKASQSLCFAHQP
ncbi:MAG: peptidoglycan-binding protein [Pseudomonadota bacterium]